MSKSLHVLRALPAEKAPTAMDLFCGAGGLTLGLKQAGFNVLCGVELMDLPARTFEQNHPEVVCLNADIRSVALRTLMKRLKLRPGELDLLAGCPPCQGFSTLRTRRQSGSVLDERNELLFQFLRFVEVLRPKAVMLENVPALENDWRMRIFLRSLSRLGYWIGRDTVRVEDAANYGVPQRRRRMILQATISGPVPNAEKSEKITVRDCFEAAALPKVGQSRDPLHDHISKRSDRVERLIRAIPKNGGSRTSLPADLVLECHKRAGSGFRDVYGRMAWEEVAPTITGGCGNPSKGRFLHPSEDRAITLREAALLQTFPADYRFPLSKGRDKVALMIGNALPPEFIKRHALAIRSAIFP